MKSVNETSMSMYIYIYESFFQNKVGLHSRGYDITQ